MTRPAITQPLTRRFLPSYGLQNGDPVDRPILAVIVVLALASLATLGLLGFHVHFIAPGIDLVIDTVTTVVTLSVAALAWARYGERGERIAIFQAAAFLVSGIANAFSLLLVLDEIEHIPGVAEIAPGGGVLWVSTIARVVMAAILVVGGTATVLRIGARHPIITLAGPSVLVLLAIAVLHWIGASLPALSQPFGAVNSPVEQQLPNSTLFGSALQAAGAVLFLVAAAISRRLYLRDHSIGDAYLTIGLVFGAFSQFHLAFYPGTFPGLVTSGDLLRLAFDVVLILGIEAEARSTLIVLRGANVTLQRLREAEADRASLEERTRLSRELHDGLAQDLWLAKLKVSRLGALPDLGPEAVALRDELESALDAGLAEARQAVMALRMDTVGSGASLAELVSRFVDDFADRFGLRATFDGEDGIPRLGHRAEAEMLRIVQESLSNVRRHADATMVKVEMYTDGGRVVLSVRDNGRGFDPAAVSDGSFGLASMRERAALVRGELTIDSRPSDGTRVSVAVPIPAASDDGGAAVGLASAAPLFVDPSLTTD